MWSFHGIMGYQKQSRKEVAKMGGICGISLRELAVCQKCGATYRDEESIQLVKKWEAEGYAPCPNIRCPGQMVVTLEIRQI